MIEVMFAIALFLAGYAAIGALFGWFNDDAEAMFGRGRFHDKD